MTNILIIGSSGDIGCAIARKLAFDGYQLILHYHTNEQKMTKMLQTFPEESILAIIQANLESDSSMDTFLNDIVFPVDGIVFAGGQGYIGLLQNTPYHVMDDMFMQHVKAPWKISKKFLPMMIKNRSGRIVLITSIWGELGASNEVVYSSVKGAQNSFVKALAKEVASCGVYVNGVSPGFIATKMNGHLSKEETQAIMERIPMQRAGKPSEVADAVCFLMDERTTYINGEIINVNGGWRE
ncbi:MAG TPA: SDR family oxidoreductase [Bacillota bacterium]|nr:SDR family oxidoreductase [Bacillota bacterium]